ncbi:MAG: hypothetical protein QM611_11095 [Microbacterium sp.]|uniref:hypothetical protein n=1 Tax=Microbacterium sp. TaxID=51671 RepID=UPI0039E66EEE
MDDGAASELRALRARAYGPDADIAGDAAALRRLEELEAQARGPVLPTEPEPEPEPDVDAVASDSSPAPAPPQAEAQEAPPSTPRRRRLWPWLAVAWAASLFAVAGLVAATTYAAALVRFTPVSTGPEGRQVAVLQAVSSSPLAAMWDPPPTVFEDFHGMTVLVVGGEWALNDADTCLMVVRTDAVDPTAHAIEGPMLQGCGAAGFPPTVAVRVTEALSEQLQSEFPAGSALRFVLDGSRVGVFWKAESTTE